MLQIERESSPVIPAVGIHASAPNAFELRLSALGSLEADQKHLPPKNGGGKGRRNGGASSPSHCTINRSFAQEDRLIVPRWRREEIELEAFEAVHQVAEEIMIPCAGRGRKMSSTTCNSRESKATQKTDA